MSENSKLYDLMIKTQNDLLDQRIFYFNEKEFDAIEKVLSAPTRINSNLQKLLSEPDPWDK